MLARAKKFKLAEIVARANTALSGSQSYEAAIAAGLQAEIAQEQLQYEKALEYSRKALNIVVDRRANAPDPRELSDEHKMLREHASCLREKTMLLSKPCATSHSVAFCLIWGGKMRQ